MFRAFAIIAAAVTVTFAQEKTVAFLPFDCPGADSGFSITITGLAQYTFQKAYPSYAMLDRQKTNQVLAEQKLQLSGAAQTMVEAGKLLGAQSLVAGRFSRLGKKAMFNLDFIDAQSGKVIYSVQKSETNVKDEDLDRKLIEPAVKELIPPVKTPEPVTHVIIKRCTRMVKGTVTPMSSAMVKVYYGKDALGKTRVSTRDSVDFNEDFPIIGYKGKEIRLEVSVVADGQEMLIGKAYVLPEGNAAAQQAENKIDAVATVVSNAAKNAASGQKRPKSGTYVVTDDAQAQVASVEVEIR